jgi:hypothetical protein
MPEGGWGEFSVTEADEYSYALEVPELPAGPYDVLISCGGELLDFTDEMAGAAFTIRPQVPAGEEVVAFLWYPCGSDDELEPVRGTPRVFVSMSEDVASAASTSLVQATLTELSYYPDIAEGLLATLSVPEAPAGDYYVYTDCEGDEFKIHPDGPALTIVSPPDSATSPAGRAVSSSTPLAAAVAVLFGALLAFALSYRLWLERMREG